MDSGEMVELINFKDININLKKKLKLVLLLVVKEDKSHLEVLNLNYMMI